MSGRDSADPQGSELSVSAPVSISVSGPASKARLTRRVADLRPADAGWDPVASSLSGEIVPLDDVLGRLVAGLTVQV